jgi:hypothetical protein
LTERPPSGSFNGTITVTSAWDRAECLHFNVVGELQSGLKALPSRITLGGSGRPTASLLVVCGAATAKLDVRTEQASPVSLVVHEEAGEGPRKVHRLTIGLDKPLASGGASTKVTIRQPGTAEEIAVPVVVLSGPPSASKEK